ncbi:MULTISPECIES: SUMF1/EgtB/PvdO family nonheme iron enzyme [unclassified Mesotoga]|uniref:SUMF1/EgtB/PvdO family nonheme iron enzyme n=1 Tax=unclassified Mesotoga TaxID=1184398 RepID=UPI000DA696ED|nr:MULTISPECIES: SUMF1/EgtB/PvdO family nonheme iron enzyme [unclassified Mesotoga]
MAQNYSKDWQVFISCKVSNGKRGGYTRDWHLAEELFDLLEANSIKVFMSSFSLEQLGESDYKQVIEEALDQARVMVVVGASKESLDSKWVKYEWSTFHNEIISGRKEFGRVFTLIDNLTIKELPLALRQHQIFNVSEKSNLVNFIIVALGMNHTATSSTTESHTDKERTTSPGNDYESAPQITESKVVKRVITSVNGNELIYVENGSFVMGDTWGDGCSTGKPTHMVTLTYDFCVGRFLVVFDEYDRYCIEKGATNPEDEGWGRGKRPVINVSWFDAMEYCNWLSGKEGLPIAYSGDGSILDRNKQKTEDITKVKGYRLLTEAEWEYAARGGNRSKKFKYSGSDNVDDVAWYDLNSGWVTQQIGKKAPNELGLYDMSGNVWEWCSDWWDSRYYSKSPTTNPYNGTTGSRRVLRGGSWRSNATLTRVADRINRSPARSRSLIGFRIARTVF